MDACQTSAKLQNCEVCVGMEAKYTCPKCEVRTCSLPCVERHKKELECDGIRNKVSFKAISQMTNLDLLSDYRMLEDITRSVVSFHKDEMKRFYASNNLPTRLFRLRAAANRRQTQLKFLPKHFSKNKNNTSYLDFKTQIIQWRVEWVFPQAENYSCVEEKMLESNTLGLQLDQYLDPDHTDPCIQARLKWYQAAGILGVVLLLKAEGVSQAAGKFYELDPTLALRDNLRGKTIIEYPVIHVVLLEHKDNYNIVDADDEAESCVQQGPGRWNVNAGTKVNCNLLTTQPGDSDSDDGSAAKKRIQGLDIPFYEQLPR